MSDDKVQVFGAFSIDNSTLKGRGYKFDEGLLKQLIQFADSPIQVIFSDIIHNEAKKHIASNISDARANIEKAISAASKHLHISGEQIASAQKALSLDGSDAELAETRLRNYYNKVHAKIIESGEYLDTRVLMEKYFATQSPFESKKDKKNEFPDAIALICLEKWAEENETKILIASEDKGWRDFAEQSEWITVKKDLSEAIATVQPEKQVQLILENLHKNGFLKMGSPLYDSIEDAIKSSLLDVGYVDIEASSTFYFEYDDVEISYISHNFIKDEEGKIKVNIVGIESDQIMLTVDVYIQCEISASFDFSVWDSIDKEYVGLFGNNSISTEEEYHSEILIELYGDFNQGYTNMDIGEITVSETISHAEFGEIEPDFHDDYEE